MGIKITSISEALENNGIKILIHGLAGSGKTVFCATTGVKTLIISAESGLLSIAGAPDFIHTTVVKTISELEKVYDHIEKNPNEYDCIALDSISEIAEVLLAQEKKLSKDPRAAYGNLSDRMLSILRGFRDLPNVDVIMSCKQVRIKDDDTGITRFLPSLPGQTLTNSIGYLFDEVFVLRVEKDDNGEDIRTIQTGRDRNYEAKDRSGILDMFEQPNAKIIFDKIRASMPEKETVQEEIAEPIVEEKVEQNELDQVKHDDGSTQEETVEQETVEEEIVEEEIVEEETESEAAHDGGDSLIVNVSDKVMYLYHTVSDAVLKLPVGDEIDNDGSIEIIDFKTFVEHSKRLK